MWSKQVHPSSFFWWGQVIFLQIQHSFSFFACVVCQIFKFSKGVDVQTTPFISHLIDDEIFTSRPLGTRTAMSVNVVTVWTCSNKCCKQTLKVTNHSPPTLTAGVTAGAAASPLPDTQLSFVSWVIEPGTNLLMQLRGIIRGGVEGEVLRIC